MNQPSRTAEIARILASDADAVRKVELEDYDTNYDLYLKIDEAIKDSEELSDMFLNEAVDKFMEAVESIKFSTKEMGWIIKNKE